MPATVPAGTASQLLDIYLSLQRLGWIGPADLHALGVTPEQLQDLERRVPLTWALQLWEWAQRRGAAPDIGLRLGQQRGVQTRGPVANLAAQCATLEEALELFRRYIPVMSDGEELAVERLGSRVRINVLFSGPLLGQSVVSEYSLSSLLCWSRQLTGVALLPQAVGFRHGARTGAGVYRQVFGIGARFHERSDYIELRQHDLLLPVLGANAYLKQLMQERVDAMQAQLPHLHSLRAHTLQVIERGLLDGEVSAVQTARQLGISRQTLHRRLRSEHCSFSELLGDVRRQYAARRLAEPGCRVEALSRELGFSEPSAFYKAFKGWFGTTPGAYQREIARTAQRPAADEAP